MRKLTVILALFSMIALSAPFAIAQENGMMNTPAAGLPSVNPAGQSDNFSADSLSDAQNICDQVASANNQAKCVAIRNEANPTNAQTYHCNCAK